MIYTTVIDEMLKTKNGIEDINLLITALGNMLSDSESAEEILEIRKTLIYLKTEMDAVMGQKITELNKCQNIKNRIDKTVSRKGGSLCQTLVPA